MEFIELVNDIISEELFEDALFFSYAEGGAMGCPGQIYLYMKDGSAYEGNYIYGNLSYEKLASCFLDLSDAKWIKVHLGMGNHLLVKDEVYEDFMSHLVGTRSPAGIYRKWKNIAEQIINITYEKAEINERGRLFNGLS